jgi:hypothetical protein
MRDLYAEKHVWRALLKQIRGHGGLDIIEMHGKITSAVEVSDTETDAMQAIESDDSDGNDDSYRSPTCGTKSKRGEKVKARDYTGQYL